MKIEGAILACILVTIALSVVESRGGTPKIEEMADSLSISSSEPVYEFASLGESRGEAPAAYPNQRNLFP